MREALASYDTSIRESFIWSDLREVRNMRQAFGRGFWVGGALAGAMTATKGKFPPGNAPTERDASQHADLERPRGVVSGARRQAHVRQAVERLRVGQPHARRPAEPHPSRAERPARRRRDVGPHVPRAGLRSRPRRRCRNRRGAGNPLKLRPVRSNNRQRRPPNPPRRRRGPRVHTYVTLACAFRYGGCHRTWPRFVRAFAQLAEARDRGGSVAAEHREQLVDRDPHSAERDADGGLVAAPDVGVGRLHQAGSTGFRTT